MAFPIALGLAGLFGARQLVQGVRNTGFRNALPQIAAQLNPADQAVMQGLATGGPLGFGGNAKAAFDYAILARTRQDQQAWQEQQSQLANARLDMQAQTYELGQDRLDFDMQRYNEERQLQQRELMLLQESFTNPGVAQALAARNGSDSYLQLIDGALRQIPMAGTDAWNERVGTANVQADLINDIQELVRLVENPEASLTDPNSAAAARYRALRANVLAGVKDAESLGALDEGVIQFASLLAPDATTFGNAWMAGRDANRAQLQTTLGRYQGKLRDSVAATAGFSGLGGNTRRWAEALGFAATSNAQAVARDRARESITDANRSTQVVEGARTLGKLGAEAATSVLDTLGRLF